MKIIGKTAKIGQKVSENRIVSFCRDHVFLFRILFLILFRALLDFMYVWQLSPIYGYNGFITDIYLPRYFLSWLCTIVLLPFLSMLNNGRKPSSQVILWISYLYFIPLTSYYGCKGTSLRFLIVAMLYWISLLLLQDFVPVLKLKPIRARWVHIFFPVVTVGFSLLVLYISWKYTGFRLVLDFIDVYGVRAEAASYQIPSILGYLLSFETITLSICMVYWLQERKYLAAVVVFAVYFFYYSISAVKSVYLIMGLLLLCWFIYREWMMDWAPAFLTVGVLGSGVLSAVGVILPYSLFVRRMMYVPVQISDNCSAFFAEHPLDLFREGVMGKIGFKAPYTASIARIMGEYVQKEEMNANNGLLGDLFANLPTPLGLLLLPLILIICLRLLDLTTEDLPQKILVPISVFFAEALINASWSTVLLTHGLLVACILLYFFPRKEHYLS